MVSSGMLRRVALVWLLMLCFCILFVLCLYAICVTCLLDCCTTATGLKPNFSLSNIYKNRRFGGT
jgi:hypothetical protein